MNLKAFSGDLYQDHQLVRVITSITMFTMYSTAILIETNNFMRDVGLSDQTVSGGKLIYSSFAGYFTWFLKVGLSMVTLWGLLTVIRVAIRGVIEIFKPDRPSNAEVASVVRYNTNDTLYWTLGIFLIDNVLMLLCFYAPVIFILIMLPYCYGVYNKKAFDKLEQNEDDNRKVSGAFNTMHHHIMMLMTVLVFTMIIAATLRYISTYDKMRATNT